MIKGEMQQTHNDCLTEARMNGIPNHIGSRRFGRVDMQQLLGLYTAAHAQLSKDILVLPSGPLAPARPCRATIDRIAATHGPSCDADEEVPCWTRMLCRNIEHFQHVETLVFSIDDSIVACAEHRNQKSKVN